VATLGLNPEEQRAVEAFRADVVTPSMTQLVILDFWAEWCEPCKALTPVLEKVAADYASKGVVLAKINVDENRFIAAQFQVRSIPTVYAIFKGQPVADFTAYRGEGQLKDAIDALLRQLPIESAETAQAAELEPLIAMGESVLAEGDGPRAAGIFQQILDMSPISAPAHAGLIRALVAQGALVEAASHRDALDDAMLKTPEVERALAALRLAEEAPPTEDLSPLQATVDADPNDHQARLDLATAQIAAGERDAAADNLLHIIATDREWQDGAARTRLLSLFEAVGLEDPWVGAQRRRLSAILFG
jgi:putative thioredoxin